MSQIESVDALLRIEHLHKSYAGQRSAWAALRGRPQPRLIVLDDVSLLLRRHQVLGLVGESGSGKSTTARCIVGLEKPDGGRIRFEDRDIVGASAGELQQIRREIQMIYQDPYTSLNPRMTVAQAVSEPALVHQIVSRSQVDAYVAGLLDKVGLPRAVAHMRPRSLSGGQRQRVAIARALALKPKVIVADEAVSALDVSIQAQILNLFQDLIRDLGLSMIFISHQLSVIAHLSDHIAIMYMGRIVETGPTAQVFSHPRHPYTAALLAAHPQVGSARHTQPALTGEIPSPYDLPKGCRFHTRCPFVETRCRSEDPPMERVEREQYARCHVLPDLALMNAKLGS